MVPDSGHPHEWQTASGSVLGRWVRRVFESNGDSKLEEMGVIDNRIAIPAVSVNNANVVSYDRALNSLFSVEMYLMPGFLVGLRYHLVLGFFGIEPGDVEFSRIGFFRLRPNGTLPRLLTTTVPNKIYCNEDRF